MKHTPETVTVKDIISLIKRDTCIPWFDLLGAEMQGYNKAVDAENYDKAADIELTWLREHSEGTVEVSWPEHVIIPRYNDDANYRFAD